MANFSTSIRSARYLYVAWQGSTVPLVQAHPFGRSVEHPAQEIAQILEGVHGSSERRLYSSMDQHRQK